MTGQVRYCHRISIVATPRRLGRGWGLTVRQRRAAATNHRRPRRGSDWAGLADLVGGSHGRRQLTTLAPLLSSSYPPRRITLSLLSSARPCLCTVTASLRCPCPVTCIDHASSQCWACVSGQAPRHSACLSWSEPRRRANLACCGQAWSRSHHTQSVVLELAGSLR